MHKLKIGMLGAGFIARNHLACMRKVYGVALEAVGVYDTDTEKSRSFAAEFGIEAFAEADALIESVDVVDVCTPPFAHCGNILGIAKRGKHILCEKPLIGYAPKPGESAGFSGIDAAKAPMLAAVRAQLAAIREAVRTAGVQFVYFENFVYAPPIQKEAELIRATRAQILRMTGEEAHKGNHAFYSSWWKYACGGSLISTGSHPIGALLYLKRVEGEAYDGKPIRPKSVSAHVHQLTKLPAYRDAGFLRCDYVDVEDYALAHIIFEDGTVGDIFAGATVLGGINDYVDVFANNHRTRCTINPADLCRAYNPKALQLDGVDVNYGLSTHEGWLYAAPDENWQFGYQSEMQDAMESISHGRAPASGLELACDTIEVVYAGYLSAEQGGKSIELHTL